MNQNRKWVYIGLSIIALLMVVLWGEYNKRKAAKWGQGQFKEGVVKVVDYKAMYERDSVLLSALMDSIVVLRTMITAKENVVVELPKEKSFPKLSVSSSKEFNEYLMIRYKDSIK